MQILILIACHHKLFSANLWEKEKKTLKSVEKAILRLVLSAFGVGFAVAFVPFSYNFRRLQSEVLVKRKNFLLK